MPVKRNLLGQVFFEPIPGGARWRNVWSGVLCSLFVLQLLTGVVLMTVYSPSVTTAWSSVWYIQSQLPAGWLVRGLHRYISDAMLIVLAIHGLTIVFTRMYRGAGARFWWTTLALLALVLALSLSGHLLPWDQAGYWGTKVRTNILARTPLVGDLLRRLLVGGSDLGHLTLTRFHVLHVMLLPALVALLLLWRWKLGWAQRSDGNPQGRSGSLDRTSHAAAHGGASYWPDQLFRDSLAFVVVLAVVFTVVWYGRSVLGLQWLDAPADPTTADYPARPEWHTLFLYQWLKSFRGPGMEVVGAIVVPSLVVAVWASFPFLDRIMQPRPAHAMAIGVTTVTVLAVAYLSYQAVEADADPSDTQVKAVETRRQRGEPLREADEAILRAREFNRKRDRADLLADRAMALAQEQGIPPEGPLTLLADDPMTRGPVLFAANCASCHRFNGHDGLGQVPAEPATSSDLGGYATRGWVRGLLADPMADRYFGRMTKPDGEPAHTRMSRWVAEEVEDQEEDEDRRTLASNFDAVAAYLEDESLHPGRLADLGVEESVNAPGNLRLLLRGRRFFLAECNECHSYRGKREGTTKAPEMFGYGSVEWIEVMITDPSSETRYRKHGREHAQMPSFADRLSQHDRRLIARWLHASRTPPPEEP